MAAEVTDAETPDQAARNARSSEAALHALRACEQLVERMSKAEGRLASRREELWSVSTGSGLIEAEEQRLKEEVDMLKASLRELEEEEARLMQAEMDAQAAGAGSRETVDKAGSFDEEWEDLGEEEASAQMNAAKTLHEKAASLVQYCLQRVEELLSTAQDADRDDGGHNGSGGQEDGTAEEQNAEEEVGASEQWSARRVELEAHRDSLVDELKKQQAALAELEKAVAEAEATAAEKEAAAAAAAEAAEEAAAAAAAEAAEKERKKQQQAALEASATTQPIAMRGLGTPSLKIVNLLPDVPTEPAAVLTLLSSEMTADLAMEQRRLIEFESSVKAIDSSLKSVLQQGRQLGVEAKASKAELDAARMARDGLQKEVDKLAKAAATAQRQMQKAHAKYGAGASNEKNSSSLMRQLFERDYCLAMVKKHTATMTAWRWLWSLSQKANKQKKASALGVGREVAGEAAAASLGSLIGQQRAGGTAFLV